MASKGAWSATAADSTVLAADATRAEIVLQHTAGGIVYLGFGEAAVVGQGICLNAMSSYLQLADYRARLSVHMICAATVTAGGGYQTADRGDVVVSGESTLSVAYSDLQAEVGGFLGYGVTSASWTAAQLAEIIRYVTEGVRQFYYPPKVEGVEAGYEWSFLKPTTTLDTAEDDAAQDLPAGFGRILGDFHFEADVHCVPVVVVSEARLQILLQQDDDPSRPQYASIRFRDSTGAYGQRQEVAWYPIPDDVYTLTYRYEAFAGKLTDANPYPLGGMKYSGVIIESCLAAAESRANDEKGLHWDRFVRLLSAAIEQDRKNGARYFGSMGGQDGDVVSTRALARSSYDITYKEDTW